MLVLSRKLNEKIQIGDDVSITVLEIKGNKVRLGIVAPQQVRVVRSELPPKQPNSKVVSASADIARTDISFVPIRKTTLNQQPPNKTAGAAVSHSCRARLKEIRQAANQRNHFQIVAATDTSPTANLPMLS